MWKKLKNIAELMLISWLCGGGFFISLLCLILTWKLSLVVFCVWTISCIVAIMIIVTQLHQKDNFTKGKYNAG